ncbi:MAG TPA: Na+/H+ antiporter NhaA, partial [Terrimicrobiaceae bacterium]|nr:Na+/H+ antiporter NhaA [Terrimicrobiaceae bacterium]
PVGLHLGSFEFSRSLRHWINDGLMTLFFFVVALELKRELVLGELRNLRMATLSFAGALGGMVVPAVLYVALQRGEPGGHGWGTVMATDTAFLIGCLAVLGSRIPSNLRVFLLSLAIFDDIGAILVVAIGYGDELNWIAIALGALGLAAVFGIARLGIRSVAIYFLLGGLIWLAFDASGVHATISGVLLGLMTPTGGWISNTRLRAILDRVIARPRGDNASEAASDRKALVLARVATREALSPVERLEMALHPWVGFAIMPLFAFANAGIPLSIKDFGGSVTVAIFVGFALGKPVGVLALSWLAVRLGIATRPPELSWGLIAAGGLLTGIGFTMALFIADLAFGQDLLGAAKLGILSASAVSAAAGVLALAWLTRKRDASADYTG